MRSALAVVVCTAAVALPSPHVLAGQAPATTELDAAPLAVWARRDFYGLSLGVARRPGSQGRITAVAAAGRAGERAALRLEASAQFVVTPAARRGVTPYGGLGVAYLGARGRRGTAVLMALLGIEAAAARAHGWFAELGLGGGMRCRLGYRWRSPGPR